MVILECCLYRITARHCILKHWLRSNIVIISGFCVILSCGNRYIIHALIKKVLNRLL
nr:MAG TPA: hypothetical protein [Bacteriophage sp.]